MSARRRTAGIAVAIQLIGFTSWAFAAAPDYTGLAGPAIFLWAISHPIETIKGLSKIPAERRRQEAYRLAITQCEAEEKILPKSVEIDSFIDEGAALRGKLIYELLLKHNVKAIYVQPTGDSKKLRYGYPDGEGLGNFTYPASEATQPKGSRYIKLELGREDENTCIPAAWAPLYTQDRYKIPPALPKTCLAYSFTDNPQTHYALRYKATQKISDEQFGMWSIVDLTTNKALASLTTVDIPPRVNSGEPLDCRSPYTVLAWRIQSDPSKLNPFRVKQTTVVASPPFLDLIAKRDGLPLLQMRTIKTPFSSGEWGQTALHARWHDAVFEAKTSGIGHYLGNKAGYRMSQDDRIYEGAHGAGHLLDWSQRNLIGLQLTETGTQIRKSINWDVSTSEGGFLVFTTDWGKDNNQIIARYNISGTLDWAVQIPGVTELNGCGFGPRQAWATDTEIILSQPSCNNKEGIEWRLQKKDISFYKLSIAGIRNKNTSLLKKDR